MAKQCKNSHNPTRNRQRDRELRHSGRKEKKGWLYFALLYGTLGGVGEAGQRKAGCEFFFILSRANLGVLVSLLFVQWGVVLFYYFGLFVAPQCIFQCFYAADKSSFLLSDSPLPKQTERGWKLKKAFSAPTCVVMPISLGLCATQRAGWPSLLTLLATPSLLCLTWTVLLVVNIDSNSWWVNNTIQSISSSCSAGAGGGFKLWIECWWIEMNVSSTVLSSDAVQMGSAGSALACTF